MAEIATKSSAKETGSIKANNLIPEKDSTIKVDSKAEEEGEEGVAERAKGEDFEKTLEEMTEAATGVTEAQWNVLSAKDKATFRRTVLTVKEGSKKGEVMEGSLSKANHSSRSIRCPKMSALIIEIWKYFN